MRGQSEAGPVRKRLGPGNGLWPKSLRVQGRIGIAQLCLYAVPPSTELPLLLLLLVETKTAAQHSCHMLQVRHFNGILLGIGSKVWRMLVAGLLVVVVLKSWLVCFLFFVVLSWGGVKKQQRGCRFCF